METLYVTYTHGNEKPPYPISHAIVANPIARAQDKRYIESDLNRSFGVSSPRTYEEKRAREIKGVMNRYDLVVDIHRTVSQSLFCAIVTKLEDVEYALPYLPEAIIVIDMPTALIAHAKHGVALEYPYEYSVGHGTPNLYRVKDFVYAEKGWCDFVEVEAGIPYMVGERAYGGKCFLLERI